MQNIHESNQFSSVFEIREWLRNMEAHEAAGVVFSRDMGTAMGIAKQLLSAYDVDGKALDAYSESKFTPEDLQKMLSGRAVWRTAYEKAALVRMPVEPGSRAYFWYKGRVTSRVVRSYSYDGNRTIVNVIHPAAIVLEPGMIYRTRQEAEGLKDA